MKVFIDPSRNIQNSIDREQRIRGCVDYYCLNMDHLRAFCDRPCRLSLWKRSLNPYRNIRIMDKKKKKKNKDRQFFKKNNNPNLPILYKITLRIAISSQFRQSGQWFGQFFSQFLFEKKNMIDVSGLKVIIKCILYFIVNVCNLFRVKRREEGEKRGGLLRKVFSPGFRFQARWLESLSKRWKRKLENYAKKQRINF